MTKACVIGWPISHSRSPLIHGYWLRKYGIDGVYTRQPVPPQELEHFIGGLIHSGFAGCNCTIPHKEAVFRLVHVADDYTRKVAAVNTVYARDGRLFGANTDGEGFLASLAMHCDIHGLKNQNILILGAGGAALAIAGALQQWGLANIAIANRTPERVSALRQRLGGTITEVEWKYAAAALSDCALLINTTSLGMAGQQSLDLDLDRLPPTAVVADIVYVPLLTPLLRTAKGRGNTIVPGLGMLLNQAVRGFELWFGLRPEVTDELYDLVARDVDPGWRR